MLSAKFQRTVKAVTALQRWRNKALQKVEDPLDKEKRGHVAVVVRSDGKLTTEGADNGGHATVKVLPPIRIGSRSAPRPLRRATRVNDDLDISRFASSRFLLEPTWKNHVGKLFSETIFCAVSTKRVAVRVHSLSLCNEM